MRSAARLLGIPPGAGILFGRAARRRLALGVLGSVLVALVEVAAVATVLPLMQILTGQGAQSSVVRGLRAVLGDPSDGALAGILAGFVLCAFVARALLTLTFRWWLLGVLMRQEVDTATALLRYFLGARYRLHLERSTAEFVRNVNDAVSNTYASGVGASISALTDAFTLVAMLLTLLVLTPLPTTVVVVYFGLAALVFQRYARPRTQAAGVAVVSATGDIFRAALQGIGGFKEIRVRGTADYFVEEYRAARTRAAAARRELAFIGELPKHAMEILFVLGIGLMTAVVFTSAPSGQAISTLALFGVAGFRVLPSLVRLLASLNLVRSGRESIQVVVRDLREAQHAVAPPGRAASPSGLRESLALQGVGFSYPTGPPVLTSIDLEIKQGTSVALVGGSGAGKSTLVDIVLGLHDPEQGRVLVDGRDIAEDLPAWQASIGMVPQSVYLLDGTVRENIVFGIPEAQVDPALVRRAVELAQLEEVVAGLPQGLDTPLGEGAVRLSGGQRQRLGIARALYHEPDVLVLDEATSALDNATEHEITSTMRSLHGTVTMIVVAHRLSTVRFCDQVVYLEDGRVAAVGTFAEVASQNSQFARLVALGSLSERDDAAPAGPAG